MLVVQLAVLVLVAATTAVTSLRFERQTSNTNFVVAPSPPHIQGREIYDASGLAASRRFPGILYAHNDHGDRPRIFAIAANNGSVVATFEISPATNHDWEDIAVGSCGGTDPEGSTCIYIADTGNSDHNMAANTIYRLPEPTILQDQTVAPESTLKFGWTEPDCDTLMVDPQGELYVIGRVLDGRGMVAHLPSSAWGQTTAVNISSTTYLPILTTHHDPTGGDISPSGEEVLIRTRENVFYWSVPDGDYLGALSMPGTEIASAKESYGTTICWSSDGHNYFTLGEGTHQPLNLFQRKTGTHVVVG